MKPVSDLNLRQAFEIFNDYIKNGFQNKEQGKGLSTEDFTTFYKEKLDNLEAISAQIVDELPETGDKNCYYFVPDNQSE